MYELSVKGRFTADHAVTIAGKREQLHSHQWRVRVVIAGEHLDSDGILCDFRELRRRLNQVLGLLDGVDLNRTPPFDEINPTAEHIARYIAESLAGSLPAGATINCVGVTEAPGCEAMYRISAR